MSQNLVAKNENGAFFNLGFESEKKKKSEDLYRCYVIRGTIARLYTEA